VNLAGVDLNLLIVFDALMTERHVTRAGERIGLSQPAMSAALNRLRYLLKDELFIRRADGMQPTRRAEELAIPLCLALQQIQDALEPQEFIPASAKHVFKIATNDFAASLLLPSLGERIYKEAPNVDIRVIAADDILAKSLIEQDGASLGIAPFEQVEPQFEKQLLIEPAGFVCVMRKEHPLANLPLTLEAFAETPQILISRTGDYKGFVDEILAELGYKRRIAFTVPNFLLAPIILKKTDYIATLPRKLVESIVDISDLIICEPPFPQRLFPLSMLWHKRLAKDPGLAWLRQTLVEIVKSMVA
jgi:DNA-binding transcriptional LysR family regulator